MTPTRRTRLALLAAFCGAVLAANLFLNRGRAGPAVPVEALERGALELTVNAQGVVELETEKIVAAEVSESVLRKTLVEGMSVAKGDVLVELSSDKTQVDFLEAENAFKEAVSAKAKAEEELRVQKRLFRQKAVARIDVENARRAAESAALQRALAERKLALARAKLESVKVRAPIAGTVVKDFLQNAASVKPGEPLFSIGDLSRRRIRVQVDELDAPKLAVGQPVVVRVDAYPDRQVRGRLKSVATKAQKEGFTKLDAVVSIEDDLGLALKPNMTAHCAIVLGRVEEALSVPLEAVVERDKRSFVYVVDGWRRLERRPVTLGRGSDDRVEVLSGLTPGERVVARDAYKIKLR